MRNYILLLVMTFTSIPCFATTIHTLSFDYSDSPLLLFGASRATVSADFGMTFESIDTLEIKLSFIDDLFDPGEKISTIVAYGYGGSGYGVVNSTSSAFSEYSFIFSGVGGCVICPAGSFLDGVGSFYVSADLSLPSSALLKSIDVSIKGVVSKVPEPPVTVLLILGVIFLFTIQRRYA